VAYADFVTALMALFIALWVMNSDADVKKAVSGYFKDPRRYSTGVGAAQGGSGETFKATRDNMSQIQSEIERALRSAPEFERIRKNIVLSMTAEGLRIELMESEQGMFFVNGSPEPTEEGKLLLKLLAAEIGRMPNAVIIEGHTDAHPFRNAARAAAYGNWELSTERANAARRLLCSFGVRAGQVMEVRGFAERRPMDAANPNGVRNRRISLVVQFTLAGGSG
jgi:chemotaxis protein MotB